MFKYSLYITIISLIFASCVSSPDYSDIPEITFLSMSDNQMIQGIGEDSLFLSFSFTDGDGDIGESANNNILNVTLIDNRTGEIYDRFKTPEIPQQGTGNGISGEVRLLVLTTCCIFPDGIPPCMSPVEYPTNELSFDIQLTDRAGNQSNVITTPSITLLCN